MVNNIVNSSVLIRQLTCINYNGKNKIKFNWTSVGVPDRLHWEDLGNKTATNVNYCWEMIHLQAAPLKDTWSMAEIYNHEYLFIYCYLLINFLFLEIMGS